MRRREVAPGRARYRVARPGRRAARLVAGRLVLAVALAAWGAIVYAIAAQWVGVAA